MRRMIIVLSFLLVRCAHTAVDASAPGSAIAPIPENEYAEIIKKNTAKTSAVETRRTMFFRSNAGLIGVGGGSAPGLGIV